MQNGYRQEIPCSLTDDIRSFTCYDANDSRPVDCAGGGKDRSIRRSDRHAGTRLQRPDLPHDLQGEEGIIGQSTQNPNMPLRNLFYVANIYSNLTKDENLYSSTRVKIPEPRFVVFYNGTEEMEE
ncbi:hypothetical protein ACQRBN_04585 [Bariatricus sp. SGI.154]|uniref:hypothetical protein n=1 Tax=Bariatricus sp. SGI.154 TaxID=3420549 RepID=UPI003D056701